MLCACGANCSTCPHLGVECRGTCEEMGGRVYWASYLGAEVCPVYKCAKDRNLDNCGGCEKLPCDLWFKLKDPGMTESEHRKSIDDRVKAFRSTQQL